MRITPIRAATRPLALLALALAATTTPTTAASLDTLVQAYPSALAGHDGTTLLWQDGTHMPASDSQPDKPIEQALHDGSILDQLRLPYPAGPTPPGWTPDSDPGRIRNKAFFDHMYGNCHLGETDRNLAHIAWLPATWGHTITVTRTNGIADRLKAISSEIEALPPDIRRHAYPAGAYACRAVADTHEPSMHAYAAAIDLNPQMADYWLWRRGKNGTPTYANRMPPEIVEIFERHGFIWGGKWQHFDTMHFEYRPELLPPPTE